jgi:hypothetical protein
MHEFRALTQFALGDYRNSAATIHSVLAVGPGWDWATMRELYPSIEVYTEQRKALEKSEWVGSAFADRARAMHVGDADPAPIHGQATVGQAKELVDEGVMIAPLPFPIVPPDAIN